MRPFQEGLSRAVAHLSRLCRLLSPALFAALACGGGAPIDPGTTPDALALEGEFSKELAWEELKRLVAFGPRGIGSEGAAEAARHIRERLEGWQLEIEEVGTTVTSDGFGPLALTHLVATLPGRSSDRLVLVAPYGSDHHTDSAFLGVNDGASGAALLVELARVLSGRERPYTIELAWLDGEGRLGRGSEEEREARWLGSTGLAAQWEQQGRLDGIRLLVAFNRVCDADLRIARDLGSHRSHREDFWRAARRVGRERAFPPHARHESVASSHTAFRDRGLRRVVAIVDTVFGGDEPPGQFAGEADAIEHCAPESLETVGVVTLEALDTIGRRLEKIDRFARTPSAEPPEPPTTEVESAPAEASDAADPH